MYPDPGLWDNSNPIVPCYPPCTIVLPPFTLPAPTTVTFQPYVTSLEVFTVTATVITTYTDIVAKTTYISTVLEGSTSSISTTIIIPPSKSLFAK